MVLPLDQLPHLLKVQCDLLTKVCHRCRLDVKGQIVKSLGRLETSIDELFPHLTAIANAIGRLNLLGKSPEMVFSGENLSPFDKYGK